MQIGTSTRALVTGANGGIGASIGRALQARGARVLLSGRRADALQPIADALGAEIDVADLTVRADVDRLAERARDVDVLVANAAVPATGLLTSFSHEEIDRVLDVNLRACVLLARAAAEGMVARGHGSIVFISSVAGLVAAPYSSMYCATKFALRGFSLSLRAELYRSGVGVTTVFPGFIRDAGMFAASGVALPPGVGTRSPDDVARAVVRAVERSPAEIVVATAEQRLGGLLAHVIPDTLQLLQRTFGGEKVALQIVEGQRSRRS